MKKLNLTTKILISLFLGIILGVMTNIYLSNNELVNNLLINGVFTVIGQMFLNAIKLLVVPLVFVSITLGVAKMGDMAKLGRIGGKTILFYLLTTAFAICIGLIIANITDPGVGLDMSSIPISETNLENTQESVTIFDQIANLIPTNIFKALYDGNMLQIIFFSVFLGIAITSLGKRVTKLHEILEELNEIFLQMLMMLMRLAPIAVFSLIITTFATLGLEGIVPIFSYVISAIGAMILQVIVVYSIILIVKGKVKPLQFYKHMRPAMSLAFSTASSTGTLPVTKKCVEDGCGVDSEIASFVLPIGATINMDGTSIMQGVAVVFIAQAFGVTLSPMDYLSVIITATLASVGTAGVPGSGVVMLSMVITQVGLPIEAIGIIMGVDRIIDMFRTTVNITGDSVCSIVIARSENAINDEIFNKNTAY